MLESEKVLVLDVDGTLCPVKASHEDYADLVPDEQMVVRLRAYKAAGFHIIIHTARHMRTTGGNVGRIVANFGTLLISWLERHRIPFDEVHFGKPWPGRQGFFVDDRTVRPAEFLRLDAQEIRQLLAREACPASGRGGGSRVPAGSAQVLAEGKSEGDRS